MYKRILMIMLACAVSGAVFSFDADDEADGLRRVHVTMHDAADVDWADLSVDGVQRGVVRKDRPLVLKLRGGASYLFRIVRKWNGRLYVREKLQRIEPGSGTQWVVMSPEIQDRARTEPRGYINISFPQTAPVAWANLVVNDVAYGVIRRGETRRFWLKAGLAHKIRLERVWNAKNWLFTHEVTVDDGQTVLLVVRLQED